MLTESSGKSTNKYIPIYHLESKHLIVPTQYYDPETFQVNHLVSLFLANGWSVTVIAPFPSYPSATALRGCTGPVFTHDRLKICRFPTIKRNGSIFSAGCNSICFVALGSLLSIFYALRYPKAYLFAVQYSPFTCIIPTWVAASLLNRRASLWIFDLWPQSISAFLGRNRLTKSIYSLIEAFVIRLYSTFSDFFVSSPSFASLPPVNRLRGVQLLYSWEPNHIVPRLGCAMTDLLRPIRVISIGNLGSAHDIDLLEEFLLFTESLNFTWSFIGGGSGMSRLMSFCSSHKLSNVSFHGFLPKAECLNFCSHADLSIVPFRDSEISDTICYRFVSSISVGTPVICFGDNAVSRLVLSGRCGFALGQTDQSDLQAPRGGLTSRSLPSLVLSISSEIALIRSSFREAAFALFQAHFSESAAESSLRRFFVGT
jgi:glycosyltransferase involved in cell wall biosynthesis